jgi:alpha-tubulin suppressor-like RCC1 family protein
MNRVSRRMTIGLAAGWIVVLAACRPGPAAQIPAEDLATPTLWELPPAFTETRTATEISTPSPEVSSTPTMPAEPAAVSVPLAAGWNHTCAVSGGGGVVCWGNNDNGQLGDGSRTDRTKPVDVKNLDIRVVAVTAGWGHTCVLTDAGGVKCWGRNKYGELGDGTTQRSSEPVDVGGLESGVVAIAAGDDHTCAITAQGSVKCWGYNEFGQLGDGTTETRNTPVDVPDLEGVTKIAAGMAHTCAATVGGGVFCWGSNELGQLGAETDESTRSTPEVVAGLSGELAELTAEGGHSCILDKAGSILCWGENTYGQLGDGTTDNRAVPAPVAGLDGPAGIVAAGWSHTCGVVGGVLQCWGWNFYGQLGEGSTANRSQPVAVQGLEGNVVAVSGGGGHTCALLESGDIFCWGLNESGQLGDSSNQDNPLPVKVRGFSVAEGE